MHISLRAGAMTNMYPPCITHLNADNGVPPVANEAFSAGLKVRHARVLLDTCLVHEVVVHDDLAVRVRQVLALLHGLGRILPGLALARASGSLDVLALEVVDLVDDNAQNSAGHIHVGRDAERVELVLGVRDGTGLLR
jgi:hypothetical protein